MKKIRKSKINQRIFQSAKKIGLIFAVLFFAVSLGRISGTNSFFMDTATSTGNTVTAGYWIPEIAVTADHSPDGDDGWYQPAPCFTVTSTITDVTIFWTLTGDHPTLNGSFPYPGGCVDIPEGIWTLSVYAQNNANPDWKSEIVTQNYKVDTNDPVAEITAPADGASVSGSVSIKGTVSDLYIKSYRLEITGPDDFDSGHIITPGFTDSWIYTWNTSAIGSGDYEIKLTARDLAGHETSDEIDVTVNNTTVHAGDVVINEVMWMGSTKDSDDEWIELRNMTNESIDIGQWKLEKVRSAHAEYMIPASKSIPANGYFLIANHSQTSANSDLNVDPDVTNGSLVLYNSDNGNIILKDNNGNIIDEAKGDDWPAGTVDGSSGLHQSMERNNTPGDGTLSGSWHTCIDSACNDTTYWDSEGNNYGTPGHSNLSANDPSDENYNPEEEETAVEEELTEPIIPVVEAPVSDIVPVIEDPADSTGSPQADPAPAIEDPVVETPAPPADPEETPETTTETETEVVSDTPEEPVIEEDSVTEEQPADVPEEDEDEDEDEIDEPADNSDDDNSDDSDESDSSANPTD
ncbi:MAG: lamin tail domain-containing protein [Parcubacteria group bacterium]